MPITLEEMSKDLARRKANGEDGVYSFGKCRCGNSFKEHPDDVDSHYYLRKVRVCEDCWYDSVGDFIDENPIVTPRSRR